MKFTLNEYILRIFCRQKKLCWTVKKQMNFVSICWAQFSYPLVFDPIRITQKVVFVCLLLVKIEGTAFSLIFLALISYHFPPSKFGLTGRFIFIAFFTLLTNSFFLLDFFKKWHSSHLSNPSTINLRRSLFNFAPGTSAPSSIAYFQ